MSSPIVYLGPVHTGKVMFDNVCLYNGFKTVLIRENDHIQVKIPISKDKCKSFKYGSLVSGEVFEHIGKDRLIIREWEYAVPNNKIDSRNVTRRKDSDFQVHIDSGELCKMSCNQIHKVLSKHTDACFWIVAPNLEEIFEMLCNPVFSKCKFLIPYRKYGIVKQILRYLSENNEPIDSYFFRYEIIINTLNHIGYSYDFFDMSDHNAYKDLGLDENLNYDHDTHTFTAGDDDFKDQYDTNEKAKLMVDLANQYVNDRKDYLTSLFPDIVL